MITKGVVLWVLNSRPLLSQEQVKKFQALYKDYCGEDISFEQASEEGIRLINLMRLLCKPTNHQAKSPVKRGYQKTDSSL